MWWWLTSVVVLFKYSYTQYYYIFTSEFLYFMCIYTKQYLYIAMVHLSRDAMEAASETIPMLGQLCVYVAQDCTGNHSNLITVVLVTVATVVVISQLMSN